MFKDDATRLHHMLDATEEALRFIQDHERVDLSRDRILVLALIKEIEIIGEAAYQITEKTQERFPDIPWQDIISMRHRLVHAYFDINLDILWETVRHDLPPLAQALHLAIVTL